MRKLFLSAIVVAALIAAVVTFVPEARQRAEALTGLKLGADPIASSDTKAPAKKSGPAAAPVTVATVVEADMPIILTSPGTVEALATVAVRTRVDGQIISVGFSEGDLVNEGQVLFQLDDRLVKAQIQQAEANIAKDEASLADAAATLNRRELLVRQKITTEALLDTARAAVGALKASIAAGRAALDVQKTQLDYLTIKAPITGRTGSLSAKLGANIRAADATPLVTLNQTKPIAVGFAMPQTDLTALRDALKRGAKADLIVPGSKPVRTSGDLTFVDNQVDKTTGTVTAKVTSPNTEEVLWPGLAVEVELTVEVKPKIAAVPASAVLPAQQGMMTWVVAADNKVAPRQVTLERIVGQLAYVTEGLKAGERVVTDGQLRLAPGATVSVQEPKAAPLPKSPGDTKPKPEADKIDMKPAPGASAKGGVLEGKTPAPAPGRS
jgi:membrane fusion protein, multidrug efflux system